MSGFFKSKKFREAWMTSIVAAVLFPFLIAATNGDPQMSYLERVNEGYLQRALSFAVVYFIIQCIFGILIYRRMKKMAAKADKGANS